MFPKALRVRVYISLIAAATALSPATSSGQSRNADSPKLDKALSDLVRSGEPDRRQRVIIRLSSGGGPALTAKLRDE